MDDFTVTQKDWPVSQLNVLLSALPGGTLQEYNLAEWLNNSPDPSYHRTNVDMVSRLVHMLA